MCIRDSLSGARLRRYAHLDALSARGILERHPDTALIVTDGVFSMDGDIAPLRELAALARQYDCLLYTSTRTTGVRNVIQHELVRAVVAAVNAHLRITRQRYGRSRIELARHAIARSKGRGERALLLRALPLPVTQINESCHGQHCQHCLLYTSRCV